MTVNTRYVVVEYLDFYSPNNAGSINELEFRNPSNALISFTTTALGIYQKNDSYTFWDSSQWDRSNLNDGVYDFSNSTESRAAATLLGYPGSPGTGNSDGRFIIDFGSVQEIYSISAWSGGQSSLPLTTKMVNFYAASQYYDRNDTELQDFNETFDGLIGTVSWDQIYSTAQERNITLPAATIGQGNGNFWNDAGNLDTTGMTFVQTGWINTDGNFSSVDNGGTKVEKWIGGSLGLVYKVV